MIKWIGVEAIEWPLFARGLVAQLRVLSFWLGWIPTFSKYFALLDSISSFNIVSGVTSAIWTSWGSWNFWKRWYSR